MQFTSFSQVVIELILAAILCIPGLFLMETLIKGSPFILGYCRSIEIRVRKAFIWTFSFLLMRSDFQVLELWNINVKIDRLRLLRLFFTNWIDLNSTLIVNIFLFGLGYFFIPRYAFGAMQIGDSRQPITTGISHAWLIIKQCAMEVFQIFILGALPFCIFFLSLRPIDYHAFF